MVAGQSGADIGRLKKAQAAIEIAAMPTITARLTIALWLAIYDPFCRS
jgi:hypothetical protein